MDQKIIQIGSSAGVTMSPDTLEELGVQVGDIVETDKNNGVFSVKPKQKKTSKHIDPKVLVWTDDFIAKNRELLERLKNK
jgi:antitoxin component of MazEF toxin-antitoxin module